jgi:hypothetical protein
MSIFLRLIFIFVLNIFIGQAWSYISTTDVIYTYDADGHFYNIPNIEPKVSKSNYDGRPNTFKSVDNFHTEHTDQKAQVGSFFAFVGDLVVTNKVPDKLYHYTMSKHADSIAENGLRPGASG